MMFGLGSFEVGLTLHGQQDLSLGPDQLSQIFLACMLVMIATQLLVFPFLIKRWPIQLVQSRRRDVTCNHVDCSCVWCRCGGAV